jgi:hypothetical protein
MVECGCGCGKIIIVKKHFAPSEIKRRGTVRYSPGHQSRGKKHTPEQIEKSRHIGEENGRWKGGVMTDNDGYVLVKNRSHPYATKSGYVRKHRLVMEYSIGRYLEPYEVVHHINGDKADNRLDNLKLFSNHGEHQKYEQTGRKRKVMTGVWFTCEVCGTQFYRCKYWKDKTVRWCSWQCRYPHSSK